MDDLFRYTPETTRRQLGLETFEIADARLYLARHEKISCSFGHWDWEVPIP
jgi:hypothetical protein